MLPCLLLAYSPFGEKIISTRAQDADAEAFGAVAADDTYVYVQNKDGLCKFGTGYGGTIPGKLYAENTAFPYKVCGGGHGMQGGLLVGLGKIRTSALRFPSFNAPVSLDAIHTTLPPPLLPKKPTQHPFFTPFSFPSFVPVGPRCARPRRTLALLPVRVHRTGQLCRD